MKDEREELCRQILDGELLKRGFIIRQWEKPTQDPPDRFLILDGKKYAVEMTTTRHQTTAIDGGSIPSEQYEAEIVRFFEDLKKRAKDAGLLRGTYCLSVFKPFATRDFRTHREDLLRLLVHALERLADTPEGWRWEPPMQYMDTFELWKVEESGANIIRSGAGCQGEFGSFEEPKRMLKNVAEDKRRKLQKKGVSETPILVVLNTFDLSDGPEFREVATNVPEIDFFEAVFLIDRSTGSCTELTDSVQLHRRAEVT
jgi:hypothetical protein